MTQQILVIHGGTSFEVYEDYIAYLKNKEINLEKIRSNKDWKDSLSTRLGKNFDVLTPKMPNGMNARYSEWKLWLEKIIPLLDNNIILIGHSLGGIFLAKYLCENLFGKTIKATILVAAPFDNANSEESLTDFALPKSLEKFANQGGTICLIQSKDDPVVPFEQVEKYKQQLPNARILVFEDRGHFKQVTFPELVSLIQNL